MNLEMSGNHLPEWDTKNQTSLEVYLELVFVTAHSLILLGTFFVGIVANVFVVLAVYKQKTLQTSNNALVVNLAVIDFLRCVIDCPVLLTIVSTVYQKGIADGMICEMQVVSFSFSCCVQMLTLACISAERYQAISQPFKTGQRRRRIMVLIPLTWMVAIVVAIFCLKFLKDSPVYVKCKGGKKGKQQASYDTFGLYMLLPLWAACFSVITGFYARIFILVRSHNRKIFDKGVLPVAKKGKVGEKQQQEESNVMKKELNVTQVELVTQAAPKSFNKDTVAALLTPKPQQCISLSPGNEKESKNTLEIIELETERPYKKAIQDGEKPFETEQSKPKATGAEVNEDATVGVKSSTLKLQQMSNNLNTENPDEKKVQNDKSVLDTDLNVQPCEQTNNVTSDLQMKPQQADDNATGAQVSPVTNTEADAAGPSQNIEGAVCIMPSKANRERANKKKESQMAKRAGYIIVTFLLFWLPIITTIILNFALHQNENLKISVVQDLEVLTVSVACITSLSNPIIYAAVNPLFRAEFYRLKNKIKSMYNAEA